MTTETDETESYYVPGNRAGDTRKVCRGTHREGQEYCTQHGSLRPLLPLPTRSDEVDYHTGPQWHVCAACRMSYLCWEKHAHGHPGCRASVVVRRADEVTA